MPLVSKSHDKLTGKQVTLDKFKTKREVMIKQIAVARRDYRRGRVTRGSAANLIADLRFK